MLVGLCTHLGCSPEMKAEIKPEPFDPDWKGGYFCPCHKSQFDMAGRVFQGVPAPTNLVVPPHYYENDTTHRDRRRPPQGELRKSWRTSSPAPPTASWDWVNARAPGMMPVYRKHMTEYYAPKNFNIWYYFGSLALLVLVNQIVTGIFLTMHFKPSRGRGVRLGRIHHARRGVGLADPLHALAPAPRCSSSSSTCTCSAA